MLVPWRVDVIRFILKLHGFDLGSRAWFFFPDILVTLAERPKSSSTHVRVIP